MSRRAIQEAVRDLGWSVFTELGVPGVVRHHQSAVIDPEPLIVASSVFFELDLRLRDQIYGWCKTYADRISVSRLQGLLNKLEEPNRRSFAAFAATLRSGSKARWPMIEGVEPWRRPPDVKPPRLPLERPALLRLRLRALLGVGARADVFCELFARTGAWTRISELADDGYSKRAIALILSDLAGAGFVKSRTERNALHYQLAHPELLYELTGAGDLAFPSWRKIMLLVRRSLALVELEKKPDGVRRVEANMHRKEMKRLADQLWLNEPPVTRGNPEAYDEMDSWVTTQMDELAKGSSPALGVLKVRAAAVEGGGEVWVWLHRSAANYERLSATLREPHRAAEDVACTAVSPTADGWTSFQLMLEPRLNEVGVHNKVEHLVSPMKVAWRRVLP
ncbi:MAG: hypothetical protein HN348_17220 [Proteobacteria bacterium]|nr:hypothetical protein [Pseudomonadota bacterium]